jgi:hypothetical protein
VSNVLTTLDQAEKLQIKWSELNNSSSNSSDNSSANSRGTPYPLPVPVPEPQPQPIAESLSPYLKAAERLGSPFDYAAAAARLSPDLQKQWLQIPIDEWGRTGQSLATSFFAGQRAKVPPTLIDLIVKPRLRQELIEGKADAKKKADAAAAGVSAEELRAQRKAAMWRPNPGSLRASLGASRVGRSTDGGGKAA